MGQFVRYDDKIYVKNKLTKRILSNNIAEIRLYCGDTY